MFINKKVGTGDAPIGFTSSRHFFTRNIIHSLSQSNSKEYLRSHALHFKEKKIYEKEIIL